MRVPDFWLTRREAARRLGVTPTTVDAVAMAGGVRLRELPGTSRRYHAEDIANLVAASERRAGPPSSVQGVAS